MSELGGPGLALATPAEKHRLIRLLDLRATVYCDDADGEDAVQVQVKPKRYVRLEWLDTTVSMGSDRRLFKLRLIPRPWHFELIAVTERQISAAAD
jgi:hypothetical protein